MVRTAAMPFKGFLSPEAENARGHLFEDGSLNHDLRLIRMKSLSIIKEFTYHPKRLTANDFHPAR
jgi:hypothetical protein